MKVALIGQSGPYTAVALTEMVKSTQLPQPSLVINGVKKSRGFLHHRFIQSANNKFYRSNGQDLTERAFYHRLPVLETIDINSNYVFRKLVEQKFDLGICFGFHHLFSSRFLPIFRYGIINCSPSALPYLGGPAPIWWAARNGDQEL